MNVCGPSRLFTTPQLSVVEAMSRSDFYAVSAPVTVRETHTAWVFLTGNRAYKVKKPLRTAFLDFSTLDRRRLALKEELRVNCEQRARDRTPADARGSDAAPAAAGRLGASFSDWDELPPETILALSSHRDAGLLVDQIADWLDTRAPAALTPDTRLDMPASELLR